MATPTDIVNEAILMMGDNQPLVTGTYPAFDTSPAGKAAAVLYGPAIAAVMRQYEWDFGRTTAALAASGNTAPFPWSYEFLYPSGAIQVWQLTPTTTTDPNDPIPTNWIVANTLVGGVQKKVLHTNFSPAQAIYNDNPSPDLWDGDFHQAAVRLLASALAMAIGGKPDLAQSMLESGSAFETIAEARVD